MKRKDEWTWIHRNRNHPDWNIQGKKGENEENTSEFWDIFKQLNIWVSRIPKGGRVQKNTCQEIMAENFPNKLHEDETINLQVKVVQWLPNIRNIKGTAPRLVIILLIGSDKEKTLEAVRDKKTWSCYVHMSKDKDCVRFLVRNNISKKTVQQHL